MSQQYGEVDLGDDGRFNEDAYDTHKPIVTLEKIRRFEKTYRELDVCQFKYHQGLTFEARKAARNKLRPDLAALSMIRAIKTQSHMQPLFMSNWERTAAIADGRWFYPDDAMAIITSEELHEIDNCVRNLGAALNANSRFHVTEYLVAMDTSYQEGFNPLFQKINGKITRIEYIELLTELSRKGIDWLDDLVRVRVRNARKYE